MEHHFLRTYFISLIVFYLCNAQDLGNRDNYDCTLLIDKYDRSAMLSRNFMGGVSYRWPNAVVPYSISGDFTQEQKNIILGAMKLISDATCVQFKERTSEVPYTDITKGRSCFANYGYIPGRERTKVFLRDFCLSSIVVTHELLHVLGFAHEHTRPDRDEFVQINWDNIESGRLSNFWRNLGENEAESISPCFLVRVDQYANCHSGYRGYTFGKAYDYGSIMHYGLYSFSKNGKKTITLKRSTSIEIPNMSTMSSLDVEKIKSAYECDTQ